jgi:cytochrome c-type biogenesis protein CcmH
MVCQNESIDESHAELAHDLRVLVRDRLKKGDTDQKVIDYVADRYGEFVLLKPRFNLRNLLLWATPLIVFVGGAALAWTTARRRGRALSTLSADEEERLRRVLDERG